MRISVNGSALYFDVEGLGLRPAGARMRELPTLVLLHGGPGVDHTIYKPAFSALAEVAQLVYLDHRGCGRSDASDPAHWNLAQWADDLKLFCDSLGIQRPLVYGASFGGMVAMTYATRHPGHPGGLILDSTAARPGGHAEAKVAMFARLGGPAAGELAHRRFVLGDTSEEVLAAWLQIAVPLYTRRPADAEEIERALVRRDVTAFFNRPGGEARSMDLLPDLARLQCRTLVLGGLLDPMLPIECQRELAAAVPPALLSYHEFDDCGHVTLKDGPAEVMALVRQFVVASAA